LNPGGSLDPTALAVSCRACRSHLGHVREPTETQASRAGNPLIVQNDVQNAANWRRVRARNVRAAGQTPCHLAPPSREAGPTMRSMVVLAIPVSR